tara:strand:+ start:316 stop:711 length:396 start_codon:yes stop_codon:yes gene_type:complete
MVKEYLAKIIAKDVQGLQLISAYCFGAKARTDQIKFLKKNKIFLISLERFSYEKNKEKINSICKFEFVDNVKSKNINQNNKDEILELLAVDFFKKKESYDIILLFKNNGFITLSAEILEVTLEDQNIQKND